MQKNWTQLMASMLHIWSIGHPKFSYWGYLAQPHHVSKDWVLFAQFVFQTKFNYSSHWHATAVLIYMYFFLSTHRTNFFWDPNYLSKPLLTSTLFTGEICRNKCTYFRRPTKRSAHFCCATGKEKISNFPRREPCVELIIGGFTRRKEKIICPWSLVYGVLWGAAAPKKWKPSREVLF